MTKSFWIGVLFYAGAQMGYQDAIGLDRYIELVRSEWVQLPPYVGFGIALMALVIDIAVSGRRTIVEAHIRVLRREMDDARSDSCD